MAAQFATPEAINFMATHGRGPDLPGAHRRALRRARPRPDGGQERGAVPDRLHGLDRGARGRHHRDLRRTTAPTRSRSRSTRTRSPDDLVQPGHVFPLKAKDGGVLERTGQTEAGVDLARLAGLIPAGVICEIMNEDGTMARVPDLVPYCERARPEDDHGRRPDRLPAPHREAGRAGRRRPSCRPTFGEFTAVGYRSLVDDKHHVAMVKGDVAGAEDVLVRVHSECLTGDVFHSLRCDCGEQLEAALAMIEREGTRRPALPLPGGPRDRPAQQAARLQAAGGGPRHRRRQPQARPARRPARLRDRRPDPRRPRADAASASSPTTRRRSSAWRATASRSPTRSRSRRSRTRTTRTTCARSATSSATRSTTRACRSTRS